MLILRQTLQNRDLILVVFLVITRLSTERKRLLDELLANH